jgi:hypothetical protein
MKRFVVLCSLLAAPAVHADKNYLSGKGGSWDCGKDPVVNINHGSGTFTFTGACKQINLNGGSTKLTVASADEINVSGGSNTVTIDEVGTLNVNGANNTVTWKKAKSGSKPTISVNGVGNSVSQVGGGTDKTDKTAPADKTKAPVDKNTIDCAKKPTYSVNTDENTLTFVGTCDRIDVNGGDNRLTIESVKTLALNGDNNKAAVVGVDSISMNGNDNRVSYKKGLSAAKPKISNPGNDNKAEQVK